jgi:hypothetical protein
MRAWEFLTEERKRRVAALNQEVIDQVKAAYDNGYSYPKIAKTLGIGYNDVSMILSYYYQDRPRRTIKLAGALEPDDIEHIVSTFQNGGKPDQIVKSMGISADLVMSILYKNLGKEYVDDEISRRRQTPGQAISFKLTPELKKQARELYITGMPLTSIAVELGDVVRYQNIDRFIKREPDFDELKAKRYERLRKIKTGPIATTTIKRPGRIGAQSIKGPNSPDRSGVNWPKYGE